MAAFVLPPVIFLIGVAHIAYGLETSDVSPPNTGLGRTKAELHNVSLKALTSDYFVHKSPEDLTFLKISNSKFESIDKYTFDQMQHLNLLEISDSKIRDNIDPQTFSRLRGLEILVLRNIGIDQVSLNLSHVQELILAQNEIEELRGDTLIGENVNYLDVSNNKLKSLETSFKSLSMLSMVDVSKNKISDIGNDVFKNNKNLIRILASENRLTSTKGLNLPWLKTLDLFSNRITVLDSKTFPEMSALEELVLAFNNIKKIDDPFTDLIELKYLNLAWNHIEEIHPTSFRKNLYLTGLSLQGNKIKTLLRFSGLFNHLIQMDLSHNEISVIDTDFFFSMPNLNVLDLSFNRLKTVNNLLVMPNLKVLDLAFNRITLTGSELSRNYHLTRLNLSGNGLDIGLSHFKNNAMLTTVDLSDNQISNFCDIDYALKDLTQINLRNNRIRNLDCFKNKDFRSLCEVDFRNNPLICGANLDDVITNLALKQSSPYKLTPEYHSDLLQSQCESLSSNRSFNLWNSVKRDLCPDGSDLRVQVHPETKELGSTEETESRETSKESAAESFEENHSGGVESTTATPPPAKKHVVIFPVGRIDRGGLTKEGTPNPQSERLSWEQIDENPELTADLDEQEAPKRTHYSWYTIAVVLIGLSLILTCCNLAVFLYIRLKVWKKTELSSPQKYTFLHNEVYKNTTEPSKVISMGDGEWLLENQTRNKIFSYGKINEFLLNFGISKKDRDTESAKNILIPTPSNQSMQK